MWRDLLTLSRREQSAFLLVFIILLVLIAFLFFKGKSKAAVLDDEWLEWVDSVEVVAYKKPAKKPVESFVFDPNTVRIKDMERLGFSKSLIINLLKYREAGGYINNREKFKGIYGVDSALYRRIASSIVIGTRSNEPRQYSKPSYAKRPYLVDLNRVDSSTLVSWKVSDVIIRDILQTQQNYYFSQRVDKVVLFNAYEVWQKHRDTLLLKKPAKSITTANYEIEINSADTAMLVLLKGIGPVLSKRIVAYRKRIGGFYTIEQLKEVRGVSPVVIADNKDVLSIDASLVVPFDLTKASLRKMKQHPYLDFYMAKAIYECRKRGELKTIQQFFDEEAFVDIDKELFKKYFVVSK